MEEKVFFKGKFGNICAILHTANNTQNNQEKNKEKNNKEELIIVLHGLGSNKNRGPKQTCEILSEIGIDSLRIDFDNKGESDLDFSTQLNIPNYVLQVEAAIQFAKRKKYKHISLIGTSFGGIIALATALKHSEIKRILLRAPVLDWQERLENKFGKKKLEEFKQKGSIIHPDLEQDFIYNYDCYESAKGYSMFENASKIKQPLLILQGDADTDIYPATAKKVAPLFPNAILHIIKGGSHKLDVNGDFSEGHKLIKEFFKRD
ncbi:MAG: alpha/beta hydrolase [Candidatus Woesearchaeota archaeon]|jgi:pimeloyl-ACP methyl ester carboxylesterase